ncbi:MAG: glycosyltransferase family 2 protein [Halieaceae bacterium]
MEQDSRDTGGETAPLVSIGMPVFNGEEFIGEAIESLLSQSLTDLELLVSDNASTDNTVAIIESYVARDSRVVLYRQPENIGAAGNFSFVRDRSRGRYFMWAAHDDTWASNWLQVLIEAFGDGDAGVRGDIRLFQDGKVIAEKRPPDFVQGQWARYFFKNEVDYRSHYTYALFNRERLMRADLSTLGLDYYPDALFCYEVLKYGHLRMVPGTWQHYRVHTSSEGAQLSRQWRGWAKILYRVHPARYYRYYLDYTDTRLRKTLLLGLVPFKHAYCQMSFWLRGARQLLTGVKYI